MAALRLLSRAARPGEAAPGTPSPPSAQPRPPLTPLSPAPSPAGRSGLPAPAQHQHPQGLVQ